MSLEEPLYERKLRDLREKFHIEIEQFKEKVDYDLITKDHD